jgi:hypothetical protein
VLTGLERDRPELGEHLPALLVGDRGHAADHDHLRVTGQREVGADRDPFAPGELDAEAPSVPK